MDKKQIDIIVKNYFESTKSQEKTKKYCLKCQSDILWPFMASLHEDTIDLLKANDFDTNNKDPKAESNQIASHIFRSIVVNNVGNLINNMLYKIETWDKDMLRENYQLGDLSLRIIENFVDEILKSVTKND